MTWKTYSIPWDEWVEFCAEYNEDPYEIADMNFGTGGGDGYTVMCVDDPPEREKNEQDRIQK